ENRQTGCERLLQTVHFKTARPITTDFITDGALRRYPVERSMRKAIRYDAEGRQVFLGLDDQNGRIDGLYTRRGDGNIHALTVWTSAEGEAWEFESLLTEMPTLDECKSRL
nr:hypothetical protein [Bdellovibrionales bacterium]